MFKNKTNFDFLTITIIDENCAPTEGELMKCNVAKKWERKAET